MADAARCALDHDLVARRQRERIDRLQRGQARGRDGRDFGVARPCGLAHELLRGHHRVFGVCTLVVDGGEHRVADAPARDAGTERGDVAREVEARDHRRTRLRLAEAAAAQLPVDRIHAGRADADEHLAGTRLGLRDRVVGQHARRAELGVADRVDGVGRRNGAGEQRGEAEGEIAHGRIVDGVAAATVRLGQAPPTRVAGGLVVPPRARFASSRHEDRTAP